MKLLIALCLTFGLASCYVSAPPPAEPEPVPEYPSYLYVVSSGCWADDVWYEPCPWYAGSEYGYYHLYGRYYYWQPRYAWRHWRSTPPPSHWRNHRPRPKWRVPNPRVRDHRKPPRVIRDHRKKKPPRRRR